MSIVAIIPARPGTKTAPGSLESVGGMTLVARSIRAARVATSIDRVIVVTADADIAAAAQAAGAEVVRRPVELSDDGIVHEHVVFQVLETLDRAPDVIVLLSASSPFTDPRDLDAAVERVAAGSCDVAFAAGESRVLPWRQTASQEYVETGAFLVLNASGFRQARRLFFGRVDAVVTDGRRGILIESQDDLDGARAIAPLLPTDPTVDVDALVTDFDGVHTDDRVSIGGDGSERVTTSRSDGLGIEFLRNAGYPLLILSRETNRVVTARARKLHVDVRQGLDDKAAVLAAWAKTRHLDLERIAYLGNDLNDLACMAIVGWPIAVADAHPEVIAASRVVLTKTGGHGAIRELAERILLAGTRTPREDEARTQRQDEQSWQQAPAEQRSDSDVRSR